ncbi:L-aminoadipate-semialdehyde dehydrogenase-phosphopantetheinyl transferase [Hydra vulgaris]|uniref:L-aminoadipate-semialdehyde dehydrogenase-phosphopantetheinyl transferase n=1 Tax=Hydra vulgaris TaxID=6087 RepID=UPI001F5F058E|nr:L-aminoadipate-semialdehyde dehydrogenase-phosphopantetheinyl transferase-like [Hydra vulgaris]
MTPCEIRWVFNALSWNPTKYQLITALSALTLEEQERIQKFYFKGDYKLCLIGRLMIRQCIKMVLGIPWKDIVLSRSIKGKPFLVNNTNGKKFFFNISHHGDFTVLAASTCSNIGVDIMKYSYPNNTDIFSFFKLMKRQFADEEWSFIKSFKNEWDQLTTFYRLWCLKESYVKAIGTGIGTDSASSIKFKANTTVLKSACFDSELYIKDEKQPWTFYETMIDEQHVVSVALESNCVNGNVLKFENVAFENLIEGCDVIEPNNCTENWWETYITKGSKT